MIILWENYSQVPRTIKNNKKKSNRNLHIKKVSNDFFNIICMETKCRFLNFVVNMTLLVVNMVFSVVNDHILNFVINITLPVVNLTFFLL